MRGLSLGVVSGKLGRGSRMADENGLNTGGFAQSSAYTGASAVKLEHK
jgi:hypothetical protein